MQLSVFTVGVGTMKMTSLNLVSVEPLCTESLATGFRWFVSYTWSECKVPRRTVGLNPSFRKALWAAGLACCLHINQLPTMLALHL